jgi:hypothetical protein
VANLSIVKSGWNGVPWGASLAEFRQKFSKSAENESGWYVTGGGDEFFLGFPMQTGYAFNSRGQFYMLRFLAEEKHGEQIEVALVRILGGPDALANAYWSDHQISLGLFGRVLIRVMNSEFA